ncbi:spermidine/putrescine transport system permease protein [Marinobacter antarcticus]|uniref:Spermidine/putrescine transport system permease protein n=1 Tax=Marinobacter antarcticus TaxID=564117 RepID=A0A1M6RBF0_9GAMM|nr:ABC transporter permease [Marinobacter antarcticus]SHK29657.1 spermidine/putrescine transport system permease protein [Marinobacter antarcticus]
MIHSISSSRFYRVSYRCYVILFFIFLITPLLVVAAFSFNDSLFPSLPWNGFTWDWYLGEGAPRLGLFHDDALLDSIGVSVQVAIVTTLASLALATCNAFLFEREQFPGKNFLYVLMLMPLVVPGVILGVSILVFSSTVANWFEVKFDYEIEALRPGLLLVTLGQFAFITTIATLVISARLRKFDITQEEAAMNLGASRLTAIATVTLPFLKPALFGAGVVAFLMSFENFNTTLMLVGSDAPLTIAMFDRLREGSTPVLNAVSVLLMVGSAGLALVSLFAQRPDKQ